MQVQGRFIRRLIAMQKVIGSKSRIMTIKFVLISSLDDNLNHRRQAAQLRRALGTQCKTKPLNATTCLSRLKLGSNAEFNWRKWPQFVCQTNFVLKWVPCASAHVFGDFPTARQRRWEVRLWHHVSAAISLRIEDNTVSIWRPAC